MKKYSEFEINQIKEKLNKDFTIKKWNKIDTTKLDIEPVWEFIGLEDGIAFELYWAEFNHNDIERDSVGHTVNEGTGSSSYHHIREDND